MDLLIDDIVINIMSYLKTKEKIEFLSLSSHLHSLKNKVDYDIEIKLNKIHKLWYYDRFINVIVNKHNYKYKLPKSITHLTFDNSFDCDIMNYIPNTITHLKFGHNFNQSIKHCIPNSVVNIHFGRNFNQNIKGCIPESVTHLYFGTWFNQDIKDSIPNSVTFLKFGF